MDTFYDETLGLEITPHIVKTVRAFDLPQVVNVSLNGLAYIQTTGSIAFQVQVNFVIHENNDNDLFNAWINGDLMKVVDDEKTYYGYIIDLKFDDDYAKGYHSGTAVIQEERVE